MKRAEDYRRQAAECRAIAKQISLHEPRDRLLKMAQEWEALADEIEAQARKQVKPEQSSKS
jgi:hypothetical protein